MWAHILTFGDVHATRAASEVSRLMRHTTLRPEAWGSAHLPLREPGSQEPAIGEVLAVLVGQRVPQDMSSSEPA